MQRYLESFFGSCLMPNKCPTMAYPKSVSPQPGHRKKKPQHCIHAPVRCVDKNVPVDKHRPAQSRALEVNPLEMIKPGYRPNNSCVIYSHCNPPCIKVPKRPSP
ncbi:hypothetical protein V8C44DRAFT_46124 [Trichoderma aethiopicum]